MKPRSIPSALALAAALAVMPSLAAAQVKNLSYSPVPSSFNVTGTGFTAECWVKYSTGPGPDPRFLRCRNSVEGPCGDASTAVWELFVCRTSAGCTSGIPVFGLQSGGICNEVGATVTIADGTYHHLAGTYDGSTMRIYVDGTLRGSQSVSGVTVSVAGGMFVVGNATQLNNQMGGDIDEVRLWSVARSATDIQNGMLGEISGATSNLAGCWRLNGNGNDEVAGRTLTINGPTFTASGKFNGAASFGGSSGSVGVPMGGPLEVGGILLAMGAAGVSVLRRRKASGGQTAE